MSPTRPRRWIPAVLIPVVVIAVGAVMFFGRDADDGTTIAASPSPTASSGQEIEGADAPVSATASSTAPYTIGPEPSFVATDPPQPSADLSVVLSYAAFEPSTRTVQANGFVAGVVQDGEVCTLTLSNGSREITVSNEGSADATTTSCGLLETGTGIPSGSWRATLSYAGQQSSSIEVRVP